MTVVLFLLALFGGSGDSGQAPRAGMYGAWLMAPATPIGPMIRTPAEAIPANHAELNPAAAPVRALVVRCSGTRVSADLHASTRRGIEPESPDMATPVARVRVKFDDGRWEDARWPRQYDALQPPDAFLDRLASAREARVEVPIMCSGCGAPPRVVFKIDATGFAEARQALLQACARGTE